MKLTRVNSLLLAAIIIVNGYIIVTPILPRIFFGIARYHGSSYKHLQSSIHTAPASAANMEQLVIPAMLLNAPIHEGKNLSAARSGPWRLPYTSTPDKGGNTVIIGHRFTYTNPRGVFYQLDKLRTGDEIGVFWHGKKYLYRVTNSQVVLPTQTSVEASTTDARLTLYTCTPLWLPKNRLVVTASLEHMP